MFDKLSEAFRLLGSHFLLLAGLILTVAIPLNLLINVVLYYVADPFDPMSNLQAIVWVDAIFQPIAIGAVVYALWQIKEGRSVSYGEAMGVGLRSWGRLFGARFVAGLMIGLGLLLFIVPGVILALRWALLDSVVVLEEESPGAARARSEQLTEGSRLPILGLATAVLVGFVVLDILVYAPIAIVEEQWQLGIPVVVVLETVLDSLLEIAYALLGIVLFLFYWEARQLERGRKRFRDDLQNAAFADGDLPPIQIQDDGNPYRPPQQ